jgi:flagellar motor switch protein FliG
MISYLCMASQNEVTRLATSVRQLRTVDNRAAHDHLRDLAPLLRAALQQVRELL